MVIANTDATLNTTLETIKDLGLDYASGAHDTITLIADQTGGFAAEDEWRIEVLIAETASGALALQGAAASVAWAEQEIKPTTLDAENVLKFRVIAAPGDTIQLRVGTSTLGTDVVNDVSFGPGYHCHAFTPSSAGKDKFLIQFRNTAAKIVYIDDVSLLDNVPIEIDSPYLEADLFQIEGPQSQDVIFLFHKAYPTYKLQRFGHTSWSLTEIGWVDGPWDSTNITTTTLTPSAATGLGKTVTASATTGINGGDGFKVTDIGRLIRIDNPASGVDWGYAVIVGWTSATVVTVDIRRNFAATTADINWNLGAWSETTGYPKAAAFFEQRLVAGRIQTLYFSQASAEFEDFSPDSKNTSGKWDGTVEADDALSFTISADNVNTIEWLTEIRELIIGTAGGEWVVSSTGAVVSPTDISIKRHTKFGVAATRPVVANNKILFLQRNKRKLIELGYSFDDDGYKGLDMTRLSRHITTGGIIESAYAQEPNKVVWSARTDGHILGMTYNRDEDIVGWFDSIFGGSFESGNAQCKSVSTIPGNNGTGQTQDSTDRDEVWVIIKRTINGGIKQYIEVMERDYEDGQAKEDAYYADSILTYDGVATTSITGLDHLEGETVKIWADGSVHPDKIVASGAITLDRAASVVQVGLGYTHRGKTLKFDFGAQAGTAIGKKKRFNKITFVLLNSSTLSYGPTSADLTTVDFRVVSDPMDASAPLFTGERVLDFAGDWGTDERIVWESDDPAPFTLLAIAPEMRTNERL